MSSPTNRNQLLHDATLEWFETAERNLPWRADATAWEVMVSEFMLQQTPVVRVLPVYAAWVNRWPTPASLAAAPAGEAVRAWGRLGYPRRAIRLHAAAQEIVDRFRGEVPSQLEQLRSLPGVGEYTAAAIASFAFGASHQVLDTNVRRVLARAQAGVEFAATAVNSTERGLAAELLLLADHGARWSAAVMELGALVCTSRNPRCGQCPIRDWCRWRLGGYRPHEGPPRRSQAYAGTDRQCRGVLLQVLRDSPAPVGQAVIDAAWDKPDQRIRALDGLVADGLVDALRDNRFALVGTHPTQ